MDQPAKDITHLIPKEFLEEREKLASQTPADSGYWTVLGELMFFGGFDAVRAVLDDYIELEQADALLSGARKAYYGTVYDNGVASLAGARGAQKGSEFERLMKFYRKEIEK